MQCHQLDSAPLSETAMGVKINAQDSTEKRSDYVSAIYE